MAPGLGRQRGEGLSPAARLASSNAVQGRARAARNEQQHGDGGDTMNRARKLAERARMRRA